jgi:uncharacterized membrane protein
MSTFIAIVFTDEAKAEEGASALAALHAENVVTVFGAAVIGKRPDGSVAVKQRAPQGPLGTSLGAFIGGLVGLLGVVAGVAAGAAGGALLGSWRDVATQGMSREFVEMVGRRLSPGYAAVLAEIIEDDTDLLDRRMSGIGGKVFRESRAEVADEPMFNELSRRKAELASLEAEHASASADSRRALQQRIDEAQKRIGELADRARIRVSEEQQELDAKIRLLETTAAMASGDRRSRLVQTIEELRAERERRSAKLQETAH